MSIWFRVRNWLLLKLAGDSVVVINLRYRGTLDLSDGRNGLIAKVAHLGP